MHSLTSSQAKYLRGLAHSLKPVVWVGQKGLSEALLASVAEALGVHELIKVRFTDLKDRAIRSSLAAEIAEKSGSALAGLIGNLAILYRPHPEPDKRRIRLPIRPGSGRPRTG
jgi:RNA-binding protein